MCCESSSVFGFTRRSKPPYSGGRSSAKLVRICKCFRRCLFLAGITAQKNLVGAQNKMKSHFDKRAECCVFTPGDQVLALFPSPGSPFCARFTGLYTVLHKMSGQNYQIATPDWRKVRQCFHVNLLKPYLSRKSKTRVINPAVLLLQFHLIILNLFW